MFRQGGMFDIDRLEDVEGTPLWSSKERGPDPMAYRVREVLKLLPSTQRDVLERKYFLQQTVVEMAKDAGISERAMRGRLQRARERFTKMWAENALRMTRVPEDEL